jgi:hypothetical protein
MKINITMDQPSIEQAIKDYVAKNGIDSPVQEVKFTITRKGGTSVDAEIILGTGAVKTEANVPEAVEAPVEDVKPTPKTKSATKPGSKVAGFEPTKPVVDEEVVPDHVKMEDTTPPFDVDAVNDSTDEEPAQSKSLFG